MLDALADTLGEAARGALGQPDPPAGAAGADSAAPIRPRCFARWSASPRPARRPYGNVNPQILLAVLGEELAEVL